MSNRHANPLIAAAALAALALTPAAFAHPGGAAISPTSGGLSAGLLHPLLGLDHMLAMLAVGVWAAQLAGRAVWAVPASFVGVMILGAALGTGGVALPFVEAGIAASVVVLGLAIAITLRVPTAAAAIGVGAFALLHGHSHGTELATGLSGVTYAVGFAATTAFLHAAGILLAVAIRRRRSTSILQLAGGAIAAAGMLLFVV